MKKVFLLIALLFSKAISTVDMSHYTFQKRSRSIDGGRVTLEALTLNDAANLFRLWGNSLWNQNQSNGINESINVFWKRTEVVLHQNIEQAKQDLTEYNTNLNNPGGGCK